MTEVTVSSVVNHASSDDVFHVAVVMFVSLIRSRCQHPVLKMNETAVSDPLTRCLLQSLGPTGDQDPILQWCPWKQATAWQREMGRQTRS